MMINKDSIKWACIQPLTGGMYIGAEQAIGHKAEFILSYKGLTDVKYNSDGSIKNAANEYNLVKYLEKYNDMPPYYILDREMFNTDIDNMNPCILDTNGKRTNIDYKDLDLVVAVPVCSGLSMVTSGNDESKSCRNSNMLYLAKYTLEVIKPKMYIFENAPTLMGSRGDSLREQLEGFGEQYGYNVLYYRTDTLLHHNCQKRVRTFVSFIRKDDNFIGTPVFGFENEPVSIEDFFKSIPEGLTQQIECTSPKHNYIVLDFLKSKYGDSWKDRICSNVLMRHIINNNMYDELIDYAEHYDDISEKELSDMKKYISHIQYKKSLGLNYYGTDCVLYTDHFPAISFRSIRTTLHPSCKRICTVREYLELMGMPHDFELYGNESCWQKIGQNVPVKTAKFIVEQALNVLCNWSTIDRRPCNVLCVNNITQKVLPIV